MKIILIAILLCSCAPTAVVVTKPDMKECTTDDKGVWVCPSREVLRVEGAPDNGKMTYEDKDGVKVTIENKGTPNPLEIFSPILKALSGIGGALIGRTQIPLD